jgi:hypothetical protein
MLEENNQPETTATESPGLSIADLVQVVKIITVAQQRGAIHINEMSSVGLLYDKLIAFLDANGAIEKNAP